MDGVIILDKPPEFTSFDVVAVMRGLCRQRKAGHTGTLDPMATGVLPVLLGKATRALPFLPDTDKQYQASFQLGYATDTQDVTGTALHTSAKTVSRQDVENVLERFRGDILQIPPMYSAVQKDGCRLYTLARQGIEVEREPRPVTISQCELASFDEASQTGTLIVSCSKGTYIRTLCADIGDALGTFAVMTALRRTKACGFSLDDALPLPKARQLVANGQPLTPYLHPIESLFAHLPCVDVSGKQAVRFRNGGALSLDRLSFAHAPADHQAYRVFGPNQEFLGLGEAVCSESLLKILRLFC